MAVTGGVVNPLTLGLITGGATFLGGAIGARAAYGGRDLEKEAGQGYFFKSERKDLESDVRDVGVFGTQNVLGSVKAGLTAGVTQKAKLLKDARAAKLADPSMSDEAFKAISSGKGMDFEGSLLGKGIEKSRAASSARQLTKARSLQAGEGMTTVVGDSTGVGTGTYTGKGSDIPSLSDLYESTSDPDIGVSSAFGQGSGPSTSTGKVLNKPTLWSKLKERQAGILERRGDKFGLMNREEAGQYAQSQGWSAPQDVVSKSPLPKFDMGIKPTFYDSNYKPTLPAGDDWRNMSWQQKLNLGKKYGNK
jgi:hypothetical protein